MDSLSKGEQSRKAIIDAARKIYNEFGLELRLKDLADKMGVKQSKITNHFHSKELIIQAIADEYNKEYISLIKERVGNNVIEILGFVDYTSKLMTIQWHYRCAIIYFLNIVVFQEEEKANIMQINEGRKQPIIQCINGLIASEEIDPAILNPLNLEIIVHQIFNLGTQWINSYLRYDFTSTFEVKKVVYLKAIFDVMIHYLTPKGLKSYESIDFELISKKYTLK